MKRIAILIFVLVSFLFIGCEKIVDGGTIDWYSGAEAYRDRIGTKIEYELPPNPEEYGGTVWGTDIFTVDTSIGMAAVHAGVITFKDGGIVKVEIKDGEAEYKGSTKNNVISDDWTDYDASFVFVK